jgi:hypothetical protein
MMRSELAAIGYVVVLLVTANGCYVSDA